MTTLAEALARLDRFFVGVRPYSPATDPRERSAGIHRNVARLSDDALVYELRVLQALGTLGPELGVDRSVRTKLYDVAHAIRDEQARRRERAAS